MRRQAVLVRAQAPVPALGLHGRAGGRAAVLTVLLAVAWLRARDGKALPAEAARLQVPQ